MLHELLSRKVLIVEDERTENNVVMNHAVDRLSSSLEERGIKVLRAASYPEAVPIASADMDIDCFLISTDMDLNRPTECAALRLIRTIQERQLKVPIFLLADRALTSQALSPALMERAAEFAWIFEDSPEFISGRIESAIDRFRDQLLPPLMRAIWKYNEENHEYSWAAPGHQGGVGFTKSPAGKKFYDFYGENLFRTDTGIERSSIGSLLDHEGAFAESERYAAHVFGADHSWSVVVGTSGSNRTVMQTILTPKSIAVCDRNCHKSIEQGLILTGATPIYMIPTRNRYGIIGPIPRSEMIPDAIARKIRESRIACKLHGVTNYAVVTNCTYDGICYNAVNVEEELNRSVDHIHFDEAWYAYARFHPIYKDHFAMRGDPACAKRGATIYATHSTHKLLNALSQASYIHVRDGRGAVDPDRFNQAYMMQATTSPLYAICASNDISTAMMHDSGESLIREVISEAVDFRQAVARLYREYTRKGSWFFKPWNKEEILDSASGKNYEFADAPRELLIRDQSCWRLEDGEIWHGFAGLDKNWIMLDPIKVSILAPGMGDNGMINECGVPAALVSYYLYQEGIVPTRTTDFQIMFLFSMGITKGKWGTLLNTLLKFKQAYDANVPVRDILPGLAQKIYADEGLKDLSNRMFEYLRRENPGAALNKAFETIAEPIMTPRQAYLKIVENAVEFVPSSKLAGRITANSIIPYPPGIPMLMSGERFGGPDSPQIQYLHALESWDREFPGFEHVTEGAKQEDGIYSVMCICE